MTRGRNHADAATQTPPPAAADAAQRNAGPATSTHEAPPVPTPASDGVADAAGGQQPGGAPPAGTGTTPSVEEGAASEAGEAAPEVVGLTIVVPLTVAPPAERLPMHAELHGLSVEERTTLYRLRLALRKQNVSLNSGKPVVSYPDAIRFLLQETARQEAAFNDGQA